VVRRQFSIVGTCSLGSIVKKPRDRTLIFQYWFNKTKQHTPFVNVSPLDWNRNELVCDLLPRWLFHSPPKAHCQKSISVTILTSTAWRTLGLLGAFPARARGGEGALSPSCRAPHGHDQISGRMFSLTFFQFFDLRPPQVVFLPLATVDSCKWQKYCRKSGCIRLARG